MFLDIEKFEEVELNTAVDLHGRRVCGVADPQVQLAEVVEDHAAGGPDAPVVRGEPGHGLVGAQGASDLSLDQAEDQQREADHLDQGGGAAVVLDEEWRDGERAFEVREAAFDRALALVPNQHLGGVGLLGGERGDQRVPAVSLRFGVEHVLVEAPLQSGAPASSSRTCRRRQAVTRRVAAITPARAATFSAVLEWRPPAARARLSMS